MSIIDSLVTDRTAADVSRIEQLNKKGLAGMTEEELFYFLHGSPAPLIARDGPLEAYDGQLDIYDNIVKGDYRAADLNRVGAAMNYVADRLKAQGYDPHINPKTDWKDDDWVDPAAQAVYLGDLAELRKQFAMLYSTPEVPPRILATGINTNDGLTHTWANDIEKILEDIDLLLTNSAQAWFYSGELFSGEV